MPTTIKLVCRTSKTKKDGTAPIWLRITASRKSRFQSTGISVLEKHWDAQRQRVKKSHSIAPALNHKLQQILIEAQTKALDADSAQAVKDSIGGNAGSMTSYFESFIESLDRQGRYWDWRKYRVTLAKLQGCFGKHI